MDPEKPGGGLDGKVRAESSSRPIATWRGRAHAAPRSGIWSDGTLPTNGKPARTLARAGTDSRPMRNPLNLLLLFIVATLVARFVIQANDIVIFVTSALAIVPLAKWMGTATEE